MSPVPQWACLKTCATCPVRLIHLGLITRIIFGEYRVFILFTHNKKCVVRTTRFYVCYIPPASTLRYKTRKRYSTNIVFRNPVIMAPLLCYTQITAPELSLKPKTHLALTTVHTPCVKTAQQLNKVIKKSFTLLQENFLH